MFVFFQYTRSLDFWNINHYNKWDFVNLIDKSIQHMITDIMIHYRYFCETLFVCLFVCLCLISKRRIYTRTTLDQNNATNNEAFSISNITRQSLSKRQRPQFPSHDRKKERTMLKSYLIRANTDILLQLALPISNVIPNGNFNDLLCLQNIHV